MEIDLTVPAGSPGFLVRHPLPTRPMLDVAVDCHDRTPAEVLAALEQRVDGEPLDGAVIRIRLEHLPRGVYQALDFARIDELFAACLHHVLQVGAGGLQATSGSEAPPELSFGPFARERMPTGLDPEPVIAIAQGFLADAQAEELDTEAAA